MSGKKLIFLLDAFPAETLNFVYNEIAELEARGFGVELHSLYPARRVPREAAGFAERTSYLRPLSAASLIAAFLFYLSRRPLRLLSTFIQVVADNDSPIKAGKVGFNFFFALAMARRLRGRGEHIHAHFAWKATLTALIVSRLNGNSYSFTAHGSATVYPPRQMSLRQKIRGSAFIVAISEFNRSYILDLCPELPGDHVVVNHCGIHLEEFEPQSAARAKPPRILCVATLYALKNHELLVSACAKLAADGVVCALDLIGRDVDGRMATLTRLAAKKGIADRVCFHGPVDHGQIPRFLSEASVFALPSLSEGIPVSVMEAMAAGLPVVASRITGLPELIDDGENGFLIDPRDVDQLAQALRVLIEDTDLRNRFAARAREKVETDYDLRRNAADLADIFHKRCD